MVSISQNRYCAPFLLYGIYRASPGGLCAVMTLCMDSALNEWGCAALLCTVRMTACQLLRVHPCAIEGTDFIRTAVHGITHRTVGRYRRLTSEPIVLTILIYTKSNHCMPYIACPSTVPLFDNMICGAPNRLLSESLKTSKPFTNKSINKIPRSYSSIQWLMNTNQNLSHILARLAQDSQFHSGTKDEATYRCIQVVTLFHIAPLLALFWIFPISDASTPFLA
jgi:hypothetical protein